VGDVNDDGRDEIFLAGAKGMPCRLLGANEAHEYVMFDLHPVWDDDLQHESMGALFFDADADSDLDLYVVSGGVECAPGDELLRDRLYINDGAGKFGRAAADALPDLRDSGGPVAAADFDRDGDLDLFVGGRCVPGEYPTTPTSRLLENQGGRFVDASDKAPGLAETGMVTGAVWSDADGDGWIDLLTTCEWGPVRLNLNRNGQLVDSTEAALLADRRGWWNGIAARDLDNDGDVDYVVSNFGLNTKYRPTAERPAHLFYGDFEGLGRKELIEATTGDDGRLLPVRGKGALEKSLTLVAEKCPTYGAYAKASLADIFSRDVLDQAMGLSVNALESGVFLNDGAARFRFLPLPRIAQAAPTFGLALTDVNADGKADLYLVQNFRGAHREAGHMDGGLSLLLLGVGDGTFAPVPPAESGLVVTGDARSLAVADINADGLPDFLVGVNDDETLGFEHAGGLDGKLTSVRLRGRPGNPTGVGASIKFILDDGTSQTAEVHAGGGYLSQSSATTYFGMGKANAVKMVEVRWPNGRRTQHADWGDSQRIEIEEEGKPAREVAALGSPKGAR
jgi:hypothetical protein